MSATSIEVRMAAQPSGIHLWLSENRQLVEQTRDVRTGRVTTFV